MKRILIIIIIIAVIITGAVIYSLNNKTNDETLEKINVSEVARSVFYAPQYVAINKGFFEEEGIKVELTTGQGADKVMTAVLAGRKGGVPYMTFEYVLKQNGVNPKKDTNLDDSIQFDLMAGAFAGGNAEYVTLFEPTASMTEDAGKGYVVASIGEASGEIPYTAYFAKRSYIKENEDIIQGFTNAVYKGQMWVKEHTAAEIAEVIQNFFPDTKLEMLTRSIQSYMDIDAWNDTPVLKEEAFNRLQTVMKEAGELEKEAPYNQVVNNKYAEETIKNYQK